MKAIKAAVLFQKFASLKSEEFSLISKNKMLIHWMDRNEISFYFLKEEVTLYGDKPDNCKGLVLKIDDKFIFTTTSSNAVLNNIGRVELTKEYITKFYSRALNWE